MSPNIKNKIIAAYAQRFDINRNDVSIVRIRVNGITVRYKLIAVVKGITVGTVEFSTDEIPTMIENWKKEFEESELAKFSVASEKDFDMAHDEAHKIMSNPAFKKEFSMWHDVHNAVKYGIIYSILYSKRLRPS